MKKLLLAIIVAYTFTSISAVHAQPVYVFDIHGVLLRDDIASLVQKKIAYLLAQNRGIADNPLVKELNQLMVMCRPLGEPTGDYSPTLGLPYEIFALFSGIRSPQEVRTAVLTMIENAPLEPTKALMFQALVETTFDNAERISALTVIPTGVALLQSILDEPNSKVYIYSNAPQEWIAQYHTLFPDIFGTLPENHILCSGSTGFVKPSAAAFQAICTEARCEMSDIVLIDDSEANCAAAQSLGATALRFFTPKPYQVASATTDTTTA
ncbi:MAG: hypothetical protein QG604_982 [Candidatus Dependentiae bacterium]|nr:hypothetical protein [Candidatus Dependentiae bacterium]